MPADIKKASIALILSCVSTLIAVYFDGLELEEIGFGDPIILGANIVWVLIIVWIIWDLFRGKDARLTLVLVSVIVSASLVWDFLEKRFGIAQVFYAIELLMFVVAYLLVNSKTSRAWYSAKKS